MVSNKIARRYAKSLLILAKERGELDAINEEMSLLRKVISENKDLRVFLKSPVIKKDKKIDVLNKLFAGKIGTLVQGFITIITKNNREGLLYEIAIAFNEQYDEINKIITGMVTSAVELDEATKSKIRDIIGVIEHNDIKIEGRVNPDIIGGVVLRVGDSQIDASIARQLRDLKNTLTTEDYQVKL
jgi:F-type H+-transporting ATPase subunit delta